MQSKKWSSKHSPSGELAFARIRDIAFDAVISLWRRREKEGLQQKDLAAKIGCSPARVNKALRGPANWTLRTFAEFVDALDGEAEIKVFGLKDPMTVLTNYDAYEDYGGRSVASQKNAVTQEAFPQIATARGITVNG